MFLFLIVLVWNKKRGVPEEDEIGSWTVSSCSLRAVEGSLLPSQYPSRYQGNSEAKLAVSRQLGRTQTRRRKFDTPGGQQWLGAE